ncbi:MAG: hypothetical protein ACO1PB_01245, partial [Ramlibacter sp.]
AFDLFRRTWQSPSNAHAYRLYIFKEPRSAQPSVLPLRLACLTAISEAFDCRTVFEELSKLFCFPLALLVVSDLLAALSEALNSIPVFSSRSKIFQLLFAFPAAAPYKP